MSRTFRKENLFSSAKQMVAFGDGNQIIVGLFILPFFDPAASSDLIG